MAKKDSWDNLPQAVGKILEILLSDDSGQTALPEFRQRLILLERKVDDLIDLVSPDRPTMDVPAVCRVLKIKPKAAYELADNGTLPFKTVGRKTLFYQDGVVKYFMSLPAWTSAIAAPAPSGEEIPEPVPVDGKQRIDVKTAARMAGRTSAALYQQVSNGRVPFHRDGKNVYFIVEELQEWLKTNPPRKRRH